MLTKEELLALGHEINPDPDLPGRFYWRDDEDGSEISFDSETLAIADASRDAGLHHELFRCTDCRKLHSGQTLVTDVKHLIRRLTPQDTVPYGACPDCGAFCYAISEKGEEQRGDAEKGAPDWDIVMDCFGLDKSFQYSDEDVAEYTAAYLASEELTAKVFAFARQVASLKKWGEIGEDGQPFDPADGADDSHSCLMDLIDEARGFGLDNL